MALQQEWLPASGVLSVCVKGAERLVSFLYWLSEVSTLAIAVIVFVNVLMRYVLNRPLDWSNEVSSYLFLFLVFVGQAEVMKQGQHIRVDFFLSRMSPRNQALLEFLILCISCFWCTCVDWYAWKNVVNAYKFNLISDSLMRFPLFISYSFLSVGFGMLALQLLILIGRQALNLFRSDHGDEPR